MSVPTPTGEMLNSPTTGSASSQLAAQATSMAESILATPRLGAQDEGGLEDLSNDMLDLKLSEGEDQKQAPSSNNDSSDDWDLFLGDLSRNVTEEELERVFSNFGEVLNIDIKRDKYTANILGYGFIKFKTREQATAAKEALNGIEIAARRVRINWAQKNTTLFVGDLDGTVNTEELRRIFAQFGEIIEDETFVKAGSGKFGFVRFKRREDAETAKAQMNKKQIGSRVVRVGWGDNNIQKHCVHVQFNSEEVPVATLSETIIREFFAQYGDVESVTLPRFTNDKLRGYAFVHFGENQAGEKSAGRVIATMPTGMIGGVNVRLSYGKRQIHNGKGKNNNQKRNWSHDHGNNGGGGGGGGGDRGGGGGGGGGGGNQGGYAGYQNPWYMQNPYILNAVYAMPNQQQGGYYPQQQAYSEGKEQNFPRFYPSSGMYPYAPKYMPQGNSQQHNQYGGQHHRGRGGRGRGRRDNRGGRGRGGGGRGGGQHGGQHAYQGGNFPHPNQLANFLPPNYGGYVPQGDQGGPQGAPDPSSP